MSIQQYVSTSNHGGMQPVIRSEAPTYVSYDDHMAELREVRMQSAGWYLEPVELWRNQLHERAHLLPDISETFSYLHKREAADSIYAHLLAFKEGEAHSATYPEDVVSRCRELSLDRLLTCTMEVHARSCMYGAKLQWDAAQAYKEEILRRFTAIGVDVEAVIPPTELDELGKAARDGMAHLERAQHRDEWTETQRESLALVKARLTELEAFISREKV